MNNIRCYLLSSCELKKSILQSFRPCKRGSILKTGQVGSRQRSLVPGAHMSRVFALSRNSLYIVATGLSIAVIVMNVITKNFVRAP